LALLLFGGVAAGIATAPLTALYTEEGRTHGMGTAMSLETMAMTIGMGIGPIIGGIVADIVNVASVFYLSAGAQLIGISLFFMFTRGYKFNTELAGKKASNIQLRD
jgi:predicted MFS family arabinose efflux permease